jgi:hypothetical protein
MPSIETSQKPQLFIVAQKVAYLNGKSDDYKEKYKAVVDHLCQCIEKDGKLDLNTKKVKGRDEFDSYVSSLRDNVDGERPFSFLFIAPEQQGTEANEELQNTISEISHATKGESGDKKISSSSVIFVNDIDDNKAIKFKDHTDLLKQFTKDEGDLFKRISDAWDQFTHFSLKANQIKLNSQIKDYAQKLIDNLLKSEAKKEPKKESKKETRKIVQEKAIRETKKDCEYSDMSLMSYKPFVRDEITSVDWDKAINYPGIVKSRIQVFKTMKLVAQGEPSFQEIANKMGKKPKAVFNNVAHFLVDTGDFFRKMDGFKTDRIVSNEKSSRNPS